MSFRTFYSVLADAPVGVSFSQKSLTRQEFLKDSLVSTIVERFTRTGVLVTNPNSARVPQFGDFSQLPCDLLEAHSRLSEVNSDFGELPSNIRSYFGNNPLAFVAFMSDVRNRKKAEELGLLKAAKPLVAKPLADSVQANDKSGKANELSIASGASAQ